MSKKFKDAIQALFNADSNNIMIDCETMSTSGNAAVLQIGAARFDVSGVTDTIEINISLDELIKAGFDVSASTILWWMDQDDDARGALLSGQQDAVQIKDALIILNHFLTSKQYVEPTIWGNDPSADNRWLSELYQKTEVRQPWGFYNNRCYRTFCAERKYLGIERPEATIKHSAMGDAVAQAQHMIELMSHN